jgi:hypothetical protein
MKRPVLFFALTVLVCSTALAQGSARGRASAQGGAKLSLTGKNMKIEKGAVFFLRTDKSLNIDTGQTP